MSLFTGPGLLAAAALIVVLVVSACAPAREVSDDLAEARAALHTATVAVEAVRKDESATDEQIVAAVDALRLAFEKYAQAQVAVGQSSQQETTDATARLRDALPYGLTGIVTWALTEWNRNRQRRRRGEPTGTRPA